MGLGVILKETSRAWELESRLKPKVAPYPRENQVSPSPSSKNSKKMIEILVSLFQTLDTFFIFLLFSLESSYKVFVYVFFLFND